jgi:hypothetical protein
MANLAIETDKDVLSGDVLLGQFKVLAPVSG